MNPLKEQLVSYIAQRVKYLRDDSVFTGNTERLAELDSLADTLGIRKAVDAKLNS